MEEYNHFRDTACAFLAMRAIEDSGLSKGTIDKMESLEDDFNRILLQMADCQN